MTATVIPGAGAWSLALLTRFATWLRRAPARAAGAAAATSARAVRGARRPLSLLLELASIAAAVRGAYLLAPWLGWLAAAVGLGVVGWVLEPRAEPDA